MFEGRSNMQMPTMSAMMDFKPLRNDVLEHLKKVYMTLAAALLVAAAGVQFYIFTQMNHMFSAIVAIGLMCWLHATPSDGYNNTKRQNILLGFAFAKGAAIGPIVQMAVYVDPAIIMTAFLGCCTVFACLSASAIYSPKREYIFLGGFLSSAMSGLCLLGFLNMFLHIPYMYLISLYGGLLIFCGYVLFDTQIIIDKAYKGQKDHVVAAMELFVDFIAIFVRLVIILMRNAEQKKEKKRTR